MADDPIKLARKKKKTARIATRSSSQATQNAEMLLILLLANSKNGWLFKVVRAVDSFICANKQAAFYALVKVSAVMLCKASSCTDCIWSHVLVISGLIDQSSSVFELFLSRHVFRRFFFYLISGFRKLWQFINNTDYFSNVMSIIDCLWHIFCSLWMIFLTDIGIVEQGWFKNIIWLFFFSHSQRKTLKAFWLLFRVCV